MVESKSLEQVEDFCWKLFFLVGVGLLLLAWSNSDAYPQLADFASEKMHHADPLVPGFAYPYNLPSNIRVFDVGGTGLKTVRFSLVQELPSLRPTRHADFLNWLQAEMPSKGQFKIGKFNSSSNVSPVEWIRRNVDAEAEQTGVATDSAKTAYTVSNGFLEKAGLKAHWTMNFRQDQPYPLGIPIVDPFDNVDRTGGIDDTLAHFYDAQLRSNSTDYPLLNVACGTFAVYFYAESERSMPIRAPHIVHSGGRVSREILLLESGTLASEEATYLKQQVDVVLEYIIRDIFMALADTLKDIADSAKWLTHVRAEKERIGSWKFLHPENATNFDKQVKDPPVDKLIKTVVFSGGMAPKVDMVGQAPKWLRVQQGTGKLPSTYNITFKLGDPRAPFTGAAAYVLDRIIHPNLEKRVFASKFRNGVY